MAHEAVQIFGVVDCVVEMTSKKSCKYVDDLSSFCSCVVLCIVFPVSPESYLSIVWSFCMLVELRIFRLNSQ